MYIYIYIYKYIYILYIYIYIYIFNSHVFARVCFCMFLAHLMLVMLTNQ